MSLQPLHLVLSRAIMLFAGIAGVYGLVEYFRKQPLSPSYWGVIVVGNLATLAQGVLGLILALSGAQAKEWVHILYGITALLWIPIINMVNGQFNKGEHNVRETLIVALVSLFEMGVAIRAIGTGG
jgi:uncharacterized membrane protein YuzA (DUF378 family)